MTVGENTWVTVIEADDYLAENTNALHWFSLPTVLQGGESKNNFLVQANTLLRAAYVIPISETNIEVRQAQIELANFLANNRVNFEQHSTMYTLGIRHFQVGEWLESLKIQNADTLFPAIVKNLLSNYMRRNYIVTIPKEKDAL